MALQTKIGSFSPPGGTGNSAVTGVGFAPKAVIFFGNSMLTQGAVGTGTNGPEYPLFFGLIDATTQVGYSNTDDFSSGGPTLQPNYCIYDYAPANGGENAVAANVSLDADGFTLNWTNVDRAIIVNYLALGGSDLTNAKILNGGGAPIATGLQAYTGVGFRPDALIFVSGIANTHDRGGMGFAVSPTQRGTNASFYNSGLQRYQRTDKCLSVLEVGMKWEADLVSMDADGFTLNWTTATNAGVNNPFVYALCLKGGSYHVGAITESLTNTTKAETGVGFQPKGVLFSTVGNVASATINTSLNDQGYGAAASTSQRAATDTCDNAQISTRLDQTKCIVHTRDAGGISPSSYGEADLASFDADGFTLNWTSTDGVARQTIYLAFGDEPASGPSYTPVPSPPTIHGRGAA